MLTIRLLAATLILSSTASLGCANAAQPAAKTHRDPRGFSVEVPPGWRVQTHASESVIQLRGAAGEDVLFSPVFLQGVLGPATANSVLRSVASKMKPQVRWNAPQAAGSAAVRMRGTSPEGTSVALLTWSPLPTGTAALICTLSAPEAGYATTTDTFARILTSFKPLAQPASEPRRPETSYLVWNDPRENAFSMKIPAGWNVTGGMFRFASVDLRPAWRAVSPDGAIQLTGGDSDVPTFVVPSAMLQMGGFGEGSWYSPGYGVQLKVRRFLSGSEFARDYVTSMIGPGCSDLRVTTAERPASVAAINRIYSEFGQLGMVIRLSGGQAAFTCRRGDQPQRGYYFAVTQQV
ncbi:MAG: hypothetical protein ACR2L2_02090 [Acidobacteriota bacterium]